MALSRSADLQAPAADQLQGVRLSHLPGLCHEAGPEGHRARQVPLRHRRDAGRSRRGRRAAHPPRHGRRRRARLCGGQRDGAVPPREDVRPPDGAARAGRTTTPPTSSSGAKLAAGYAVERVGMTLALDGLVDREAGRATPATFVRAVEAVHGACPGRAARAEERRPGRDRGRRWPWPAPSGRSFTRPRRPTGRPWRELAKTHACPLVDPRRQPRRPGGPLGPGERRRGRRPRRRPRRRWSRDGLALATLLRRLALKKNVRALGYPILAFSGRDSIDDEAFAAAAAIAKYASIVVLDHADPALFYPLITLRQNIYTDPQKPIQVEPKLYQVGTPTADSPLLITTNFSLTYFSVSGEVEASGKACWLLVADADGQSVLTSWAAGKFDALKIAKTVKDIGDRAAARAPQAGAPGPRREPVGRVRRGAAGLADLGRAARRGRHSGLPEDRVERVVSGGAV